MRPDALCAAMPLHVGSAVASGSRDRSRQAHADKLVSDQQAPAGWGLKKFADGSLCVA